MVKSLPAMWETWVRSLGWEDPLKKGMATHSIILAWRTPWTGEPGGLHSMGSQRVGHDPGEVNGYPLQYSCLEDPLDRGAWWATVLGVAKELNMA